ncbi:MAG: hypothetical protein N2578_06150 [Bdellovibrionaceae bacterium]|nr:hypothetical protein [Pseudobdellovibrionaceae bacterium]
MRSSYSSLMQSRFFNPAFNSAIFDGPLRIYFSQAHESFALKVYLQAQGGLTEEVKACRDSHGIKQILIMVYPSDEAFAMSFDNVPLRAMGSVAD